ncbi:MAG TPA: SRPBCC family protein [Roseiflexaceae bacterium]
MPTFEQSIEVRADALTLFRLTQDYDHRLDWDPFLKEARLVGGAAAAGVGARAWCVARNGMGMETEYVSFKPPKVVAVKMTKGPALLSAFAGSWRFQELGNGITRVIFRYHVAANPRWMGFLFDPILRWIFTHEVARRLTGLKHAVEATDLLQQLPAEFA